ncbi:hypothetical protein BT69DRAFT_1279536 [Atractiella rhizophila]|nr:hypothetical protein BT69DRAFT_1279536 [Atractiella rhizophila]
MRRVRRRLEPANAIQSIFSSQRLTEQRTSSQCQDSQELDSRALVHVISPNVVADSIHLSILPSFLSRLPPSIHTLRISCSLCRPTGGRWWYFYMSARFSYLSLERVENAVDKDGVINLHITVNWDNVTVTFLEVERHGSTLERDVKSDIDLLDSYPCCTWTFPLLLENAIFTPVASYSEQKGRFIPIVDIESSSLPSPQPRSIIQVSAPPLDVVPCSIASLPVELLSLIFSFLDPYCVSILSCVCKLWRDVSAPYDPEPFSLTEKCVRLKCNPGAGRLWNKLRFVESMDVGMVTKVIAGSPNVTQVDMAAIWNVEEAKIVLNAIEGLKRVDDVTFAGSRKWRKEEIENFVQRMGDRIRWLDVRDVEDSPASASESLHLSSRLEYLNLRKYPPPSSPSLPHTLKHLELWNMCPLPSSISDCPLPPLLEYLTIRLAPFSAYGKTSILPAPFDFSHLTHLTTLVLDGGEETSGLVSREFFSTLTNATAIRYMTLWYCVVDSFDFPDFIRWFFGHRPVSGLEKVHEVNLVLVVRLFFGEWHEEDITSARMTMGEYTRSKSSGVWESGELEKHR